MDEKTAMERILWPILTKESPLKISLFKNA